MCMRCRTLEVRIRQLTAEVKALRADRPASPPDYQAGVSRPTNPEAVHVRAVFDAWTEACKHPRAKLTADRRVKVRARLKEGYSAEELIQAVHGAARGAYVDARGHRWDDLTLICRDGAHVERFMAMAGDPSIDVRSKFIG